MYYGDDTILFTDIHDDGGTNDVILGDAQHRARNTGVCDARKIWLKLKNKLKGVVRVWPK